MDSENNVRISAAEWRLMDERVTALEDGQRDISGKLDRVLAILEVGRIGAAILQWVVPIAATAVAIWVGVRGK